MRYAALFLAVLAAAVTADDFVHEPTGLVVKLPDGWDRDPEREGGATPFAAVLEVLQGKQIRLEVEVSSREGFDADTWLESEQEAKASLLKEVQEAFTPDRSSTIGGKAATGYTIGGVRDYDGKDIALRYRVRAVIHGATMFQITELSYNGAHEGQDDALDKIWGAIGFQEPKTPEIDITPPEGAPEQEVRDETGNYRLKLKAGWVVQEPPPETPETERRVVFARKDTRDNNLVRVQIYRFQQENPGVFSDQPSDWLTRSKKGLFPQYGEKVNIDVQVNDSVLLGGVDKSGAFEVSNITSEELEEKVKAEQDQRKGLKVDIPDFEPLVVRGRVAFLAPHVYFLPIEYGARSLAHSATLTAELDEILGSFEFLSSEEKCPPLQTPDGEIGNTKDDPALAENRKESEVFHSAYGGKIYAELKVDLPIPAGFKKIKEFKVGGDVDFGIQLAAQDKDNRWVTIQVVGFNNKKLGPQKKKFTEKKTEFATWVSNWESAARGAGRIKEKPKKFTIGNFAVEGYEFKGRIESFSATRTNALGEQSGWRLEFQIETRGGGDRAFANQIQAFLKGFKAVKK
ncbi:MAG: hypothetical protein ACREID_06315 [Planctomycetota bacterium]